MGITLREKIKQMPWEHQEKIRKRSADLMAEEKVMQQLRQLFKITQAVLLKYLGFRYF
ncbi:MAG: hypothetical protein PUP91_31220 [Rhizonema sp. PD37]|nr:hypothetical protein [Rhizonema sp. PD37]